ncbi:hypothetical protein D3C76_1563640 [compost metagenome]
MAVAIRKCACCGHEYKTKTAKSQFCSSSCRGKWHRASKKVQAGKTLDLNALMQADKVIVEEEAIPAFMNEMIKIANKWKQEANNASK